MEKRSLIGALLLVATVAGGVAAALGDEPGPMPETHAHKRATKTKERPPKVSDKCASDDDCAFTSYDNGACCPTRCQPRAVSKKSAAAIEKWAATCKKPEEGCPVVDCPPPPMARQPACVSGRCVARGAPSPARQ